MNGYDAIAANDEAANIFYIIWFMYVPYKLQEGVESYGNQLSSSDLVYGVLQERRITLNPLQEKTKFLAKKTIKVNPNGGKQGGIPEKESLGISNNKSDPYERQKELVPRRQREKFQQ